MRVKGKASILRAYENFLNKELLDPVKFSDYVEIEI